MVFNGQTNESPIPASINVDVYDVAKKRCLNEKTAESSMTFALHEAWSHLLDGKWWSEKTISEDSSTSEAPLYSLDVEVPPPPGYSPMAKLQLVRGSLLSLGRTNDWRKIAEWSWQIKCETWVWMVNGVSAWVALLMERDG